MTVNNKMSLLEQLIDRGDYVAIEQGRLVINSASGIAVPDEWLNEHSNEIIHHITTLMSQQVYTYQSYSTGNYGKQKYSGVSIQLTNLITGEEAFVIFNVELTRQRNSTHGKKGEHLPKRQFRVSTKHTFYKFWLSTGLKIPPRLSSFYDYMGKLKGLLFNPEVDRNGKVSNKIIPLLNVNYEQLKKAFHNDKADSIQTRTIQQPDINRTRMPYKEMTKTYTSASKEPNQSTCGLMYGNKLQGSAVISKSIELTNKVKRPEDQNCEEWLIGFE